MFKNILLKGFIITAVTANVLFAVQAQEASPQSLVKDAKEFSVKGRFSKAIELYEEVIKKYPESDHVEVSLFWLGYSYEAEGSVDQAVDNYDRLLKEFPESKFCADALRKKANILIAGNDFTQAAEALEALVAKYPESSYANEANSELGDIYGYKLYDFEKALTSFKRYKASGQEKTDMDFKLRFFNDNQDFNNEPLKMYCVGKNLSEENKLEKAEEALKKLVVNYAKSKVVDDALLLLGQNEIAKAMRLNRNTPLLSAEQKAVFLNYYKAAAGYFNQVIRDYPNMETPAEAKYSLAKIYDWDRLGGLNDFVKAMKEYQTVIDEYPGTYWADRAQMRLEALKKISQ